MWISKQVRTLAFFIFAVVSTSLLYSNCGDIKLQSLDNSSTGVISSPNPFYLKPPTSRLKALRAVFFVDMSKSMYTGPCPDSLDLVYSDIQAVDCTRPQFGKDPYAQRLEFIKIWIDQVSQFLTQQNINPDDVFKVMIVPFSYNNLFVTRFQGTDPVIKGYRPGLEAKKFATKLQIIQKSISLVDGTRNSPGQYASIATPEEMQLLPDFIQTWNPSDTTMFEKDTIPKSQIDAMTSQVESEMVDLNNQSLLDGSDFEFVFLSDGVLKPRLDHILQMAKWTWEDAHNQTNCANTCMDDFENYALDGIPVSSSCEACMDDLNNLPSENGASGNFLDFMRARVGDFHDNLIDRIYMGFSNLKFLFYDYPQSHYRMNFVRVEAPDPAVVTVPEELTTNTNWMTWASSYFRAPNRNIVYTSAPFTNYNTIPAVTVPFSLFSDTTNINSYQISSAMAVNIYARVQGDDSMTLDTDGDGVPDSVEVQNGTNPFNPRSDGKCLDGIKLYWHGCIEDGCDPQIDMDGDGLNECEERTIGTSDYDFDTDGDGIPDSWEVVYKYNANQNDRTVDSNNDGISNYLNFMAGLPYLLAPSSVPSRYQTSFLTRFVGYQQVNNPPAAPTQVAGYIVDRLQVPIIPTTNTVTDNLPLYKDRRKRPQDLWPQRLVGGSHAMGSNRVQILIRVDNVRNPGDGYWLYKSMEATSAAGLSGVDLNTLQQIMVVDPDEN